MKKKIVIFAIVLITILSIISILFVILNKKEVTNENTLYSIKFENIQLRFVRYDYTTGQNQTVGVEKSTDNGKTYEKLTNEPIVVSLEPKFIFFNETLGFALAKSNLNKNNNYIGVKVTQDGGKTFVDAKINYNNPDIEILTIEGIPYYENDLLKLPCSIYQVKEDKSGYEDKKIIFISNDDGLTWNVEQTAEERYAQIKADVSKELERYLYVKYPKCSVDNHKVIRTNHEDLVYNGGLDKEKLLDIDLKSYCMVYVDATCVSEGKINWNVYLSCKNHTDKGFVKWAEPFDQKQE